MGAIDIGGLPRFGPQLSADLVLEQDVFSGQVDVTHARGRHLLKAGGLVERYSRDRVQPDVQPRRLSLRQPARRSSPAPPPRSSA